MIVVVDEPQQLGVLTRLFCETGWTVHAAATGAAALQVFAAEQPAVVVLDLGVPDVNGLQVLRLLREMDPEAAVVAVTGGGELEVAAEASQRGAESFLVKPYAVAQVVAAVERAHEKVALRKHARWLWEQQLAERGAARPGSASMPDVVRQIQQLAQSDTPVLLQGETGTGKSWVARLLHTLSARRHAPFSEVNCAGFTAPFLESELFGHEAGSFTDAAGHKPGVFEVASGGTVLLDEIGELPLRLQPMLLEMLQFGRFRRIGGRRELKADVRLVATSNRDLRAAVRERRFRAMLLHRIAGAVVRLPPLRERGSADIAALASGILVELARRFRRGTVHLAPDSLELLARYHWPGNIRELNNVLEQALLACGDADVLRPADLPRELRTRQRHRRPPGERLLTLEELEQRHVERVLRTTAGNRAEAARVLGISREGLHKKLQRYRRTPVRADPARPAADEANEGRHAPGGDQLVEPEHGEREQDDGQQAVTARGPHEARE